MSTTPEHDAGIAKITFALVHPLYVNKIEKESRTKEESPKTIRWLTGFDEKKTG